jgi:hypothetical protein
MVFGLLVAGSGCGRQSEKAAPQAKSQDAPAPAETGPFAPGRRYEDLDARIAYTGSWFHDRQFPQSSGQSLTYSDKPGNAFDIAFTGSGITYVFTQAGNRGIANVTIDGQPQARINQYSREIQWQAKRRFEGLNPGVHTFEVRVSGEKDPQSAGKFVDLDAFEVEP